MRRRTPKTARVPVRFRPGVAALEARRLLSTDVLTYHFDNARSGLNPSETALTPAVVNASTFGKLGFDAVDGKVDAQPLLKTGVAIPSQGTHDVLYVATENDSVYAFDAGTGAPLWKASMLGPGEVPSDPVNGNQVIPTIGITATPVIDPATGTMYLVAMSKKVVGGTTTYIQRIHAINIATGADVVAPRSIDRSITFPGAGPGGDGTRVIFDPRQYEERDALLLSNGVIYTGWASHSDGPPYTGWVIGFRATDLGVASILNVDPNGSPTSSILDDGSGSSFWNSGGGPAADAAGNIYNLSANGPFDQNLNAGGFPSNGDFGDSYLKFTPTAGGLTVSDYFTVYNQQDDANQDADIGSSGLTLVNVVDGSGAAHQLAVGSGKDGNIYVVDTANMGKFSPAANNIYQEIPGGVGGGEFSSPASFNGRVYFGGVNATLRAYSFVNGRLQAAPSSQSANTFGYPGTTPSLSSNGNADGIAWAISNTGGSAVLYAYDATNLGAMLYNSGQAPDGRDAAGPDNKFITPVIANGRVYVPTTSGVAVYGLLTPAGPSTTPVSLASSYNRAGIVADGSRFSGGGLDAQGAALSSAQLGPSVTAAGVSFPLGPVGGNDVVAAQGQVIPLPQGSFGSLALLATGVNGNQPGQDFVVTYTDGSTSTIARSISDWFTPQGYAGEATAAATSYRDLPDGGRDARTFRVYDYSLPVDATRQVRSLTLPVDANVEVLGVALVPSVTTQVVLGGPFNRVGIVADGSTFSGGLDGDGFAISANLLSSSVSSGGVTFALGPAGSSNTIVAGGQAIPLPAGGFRTLNLLATGVNGNQPGQDFVVTYTDGSTSTIARSISDWFTPQGYAGEATAAITSYRDTATGGRQQVTFRLYRYDLALDPTRTVRSLTLPANGNVEVLGIDLTS